MNTCENCDGEGGYAIPTHYCRGEYEHWIDCPACGGSGWVHADPPQLEMDEAFEDFR